MCIMHCIQQNPAHPTSLPSDRHSCKNRFLPHEISTKNLWFIQNLPLPLKFDNATVFITYKCQKNAMDILFKKENFAIKIFPQISVVEKLKIWCTIPLHMPQLCKNDSFGTKDWKDMMHMYEIFILWDLQCKYWRLIWTWVEWNMLQCSHTHTHRHTQTQTQKHRHTETHSYTSWHT